MRAVLENLKKTEGLLNLPKKQQKKGLLLKKNLVHCGIFFSLVGGIIYKHSNNKFYSSIILPLKLNDNS